MRRYFRNSLKTAVTYRLEMVKKMERARQGGKYQRHTHKLGIAKKREARMRGLSESIDILVSWMEHDILNKAGPPPDIRGELFDFVVAELQKLETLHPHRIKPVRVALENQKNQLLAFADVLNRKFHSIADEFSCSLDTVWKLCELQRCHYLGDTYAIRQLPLVDALGDQFDPMEDAVLHALDTTERTSSMVENLNSRLSPYFFLRREIGFGYLDFLRFYLNHTPFLRSERPARVGKTPTELLTGKQHPHWLEMLGFKRFKRAA